MGPGQGAPDGDLFRRIGIANRRTPWFRPAKFNPIFDPRPDMISIIIAANENVNALERTLTSLVRELNDLEVIVAHSGQHPGTGAALDSRRWVKQITNEGSRAVRANAAAAAAEGDVLLFLPPGTTLQRGWRDAVLKTTSAESFGLGSFQLKLEGKSARGSAAERLLRSKTHPRLWQGFFLKKETFESVDGFKDQPDFEDLDLIQRLSERDKTVSFAKAAAFLPRAPFDREGMIARARRLANQRTQFLQGGDPSEISQGAANDSLGGDGILLLLPNPQTNSVLRGLAGSFGPVETKNIIASLVRGTSGIANSLPGDVSLSYGLANPGWLQDLGYISTAGATVYSSTDGSLGSLLRQAYSTGLARVAVIDPLQPGVTARDLRRAFTALNTVDVAIGPTDGEGAYAVGVDKAKAAMFDKFQLQLPLSVNGLKSFAENNQLSSDVLPIRRKLEDLEDYVHFFNCGMIET